MSRAAQILAAAAATMRAALSTHHTEERDEGAEPMSKMHEDLKAANWVETTLADCKVGDEVLTMNPGGVHGTVTSDERDYAIVNTTKWWSKDCAVLRAPRPEPDPEPVFEHGEVWRCCNNETWVEASLVWGGDIWRGIFPGTKAGAWATNEVTPLRKLVNADGTPVPQDLPEWDPEREWPLDTVVEAEYDGRRRLMVMVLSNPDVDDWPWVEWGTDTCANTDELKDVRVISAPGYPAPTGPSLRERLLDEETVERVARLQYERKTENYWDRSMEARQNCYRRIARYDLTAVADVLDPVGE